MAGGSTEQPGLQARKLKGLAAYEHIKDKVIRNEVDYCPEKIRDNHPRHFLEKASLIEIASQAGEERNRTIF
jgi:hypothetical protein